MKKIDEEFDRLIEKETEKLNEIEFSDHPGLSLLEEKFKLDMYSSVNNIFYGKK